MCDGWHGLADSMANMLERYASAFGIGSLPTPEVKATVYKINQRGSLMKTYQER